MHADKANILHIQKTCNVTNSGHVVSNANVFLLFTNFPGSICKQHESTITYWLSLSDTFPFSMLKKKWDVPDVKNSKHPELEEYLLYGEKATTCLKTSGSVNTAEKEPISLGYPACLKVSQTVTFKMMMFKHTKKSHTFRFSMIWKREHRKILHKKSSTLRSANKDIQK